MSAEDNAKIVTEITEKLLTLLNVKGKVAVQETDEVVEVNIESEESGALIGFHGKILSALELILNVSTGKKTGQWKRAIINVGDYRQRQEESLKKMALKAAERARFLKESVTLSPMSPAERRIVHLTLKETTDMTTESIGEGEARRVVVRLKEG